MTSSNAVFLRRIAESSQPTNIHSNIGEIVKAAKEMRKDRVPPPIVFRGLEGQINIVSFFVAFERYCLVIYKKDLVLWL